MHAFIFVIWVGHIHKLRQLIMSEGRSEKSEHFTKYLLKCRSIKMLSSGEKTEEVFNFEE